MWSNRVRDEFLSPRRVVWRCVIATQGGWPTRWFLLKLYAGLLTLLSHLIILFRSFWACGGIWCGYCDAAWKNNASLSSPSSDERPDFWCTKNWFWSDTHVCWRAHTHTHTRVYTCTLFVRALPQSDWSKIELRSVGNLGEEMPRQRKTHRAKCQWALLLILWL